MSLEEPDACLLLCIMLRSLPLENTVNTSSQLDNSVRYHFEVLFTSGELGNFKAYPFVPFGVLDLKLLAVYLAQYMLKTPYKTC